MIVGRILTTNFTMILSIFSNFIMVCIIVLCFTILLLAESFGCVAIGNGGVLIQLGLEKLLVDKRNLLLTLNQLRL